MDIIELIMLIWVFWMLPSMFVFMVFLWGLQDIEKFKLSDMVFITLYSVVYPVGIFILSDNWLHKNVWFRFVK